MTNNLEDFEQPDLESGGDAPPGGGIKANLSHAWRTRPLFKLLVLMIVVGAIIAVSINIFSPKPSVEMSKLPAPPSGIYAPPGGPSSPYHNEQTEKANQEREKTAIQNGGSAIPTPIGQNNSIEDMTGADKQKNDPLVELRNQIEHQKQEIAQMRQQQQQPPAQSQQRPPERFDESLAQAMQKEMQKLMGEWEPKGIKQVGVSSDEDQNAKKSAEAANASGSSSSAPTRQSRVVVPAGTVSYAVMLTEANSDVPGPILAQIVSGPLAGARAIGEFKVTQDPYLVMRFSLADLKGRDYGIDALALDPDTTLGGMATEVDERWITRILLPAAAGFAQGFGSALGQGSSSVVTNGTTTIVQQSGQGLQQGMFQGLSQAGQTVGQFLENQANQTQPLVRVAAGTPMGLFFVSSVLDNAYTPPNPLNNTTNSVSGVGNTGNTPMLGNPGYVGQTPIAGTLNNTGANAGLSYPNANVPYPNTGMPYNGRALTNPNSGIMPYSGSNYTNAAPGAYGIGTPLVNP